jgi:hypothetical protein
MGEERELPAFYPDFTDADKYKSWDGSREAELWARLLEWRDNLFLEAAAAFLTAGNEDRPPDVGGLVLALMRADSEEIVRVLDTRWGEIERRAEQQLRGE